MKILKNIKSANQDSLQIYPFIIVIVTTIIISLIALVLCYRNTYSSMNDVFFEMIEAEQKDIADNLYTIEKDLNRVTNQALNTSAVYNAVSGTKLFADSSFLDNGSKVLKNLTSYFPGLQSFYVINLSTNRIYNRDLAQSSAENMGTAVSRELVLDNNKNKTAIYPSDTNSNYIVISSRDFRGFLFVYIFDKTLLINDICNFMNDDYSFALYYEDSMFFSNDAQAFAAAPDGNSAEICSVLTQDKYSVAFQISSAKMRLFYSPFFKEMAVISLTIVAISFLLAFFSTKLMRKKLSEYRKFLLKTGGNNYDIAKSIIQCAIRNNYLSAEDSYFLDNHFFNGSTSELVCIQIKLDNVKSMLLSVSYKDIAQYTRKIQSILKNSLPSGLSCMLLDIDFDSIGMIVSLNNESSEREIYDSITAAKEQIDNQLGISVTSALADAIVTSGDIPYVFYNLSELIKQRFFLGMGNIIKDNITVNNAVEYPDELQNKITTAITQHNGDELSSAAREFFDKIKSTSYDTAIEYVLRLITAVLKISKNDSADIVLNLINCETIDEQFNIFVQHLAVMTPAENTSEQNLDFISLTNEIIESEYSNQDMNLSYLADKLGMSSVYVGQKFKKLYDETFNNYLAKYRITRAIELLADAKLTNADISAACGFSTPEYFAKTFKKITSMTPSDYRKKLMLTPEKEQPVC